MLVKAGMDGFPSGQRGQTVNLLAVLSVVRIHLHPFSAAVAELADAQDLKSCGTNLPYRFDSDHRHRFVGIAQLDRAFGYGPKGRGFKSLPRY